MHCDRHWAVVPALLLLRILLPPEARHPLVPFVPLHLLAFLGSRPRGEENRVIDELLVRDVFKQGMLVEMRCHPLVQVCNVSATHLHEVGGNPPLTSVTVYRMPPGRRT